MKQLEQALGAIARSAAPRNFEDIQPGKASGRRLMSDAGPCYAGMLITPAAAGLLTAEGIRRISVCPSPHLLMLRDSGMSDADALSLAAASRNLSADYGGIFTECSVECRADALQEALNKNSPATLALMRAEDREAAITEIKKAGGKVLFDAVDVQPGGSVVATVLQDTVILVLNTDLTDNLLQITLFGSAALAGSTGCYREAPHSIRAEVRSDVDIIPEKSTTTLIPVELSYRGGMPGAYILDEDDARLNYGRMDGAIIVTDDVPVIDRYSIVEVIVLPLKPLFFNHSPKGFDAPDD